MPLSSVLAAFNRLPLWRRHLSVWGFSLRAPTFDRWLYLILHRLDRMGREERTLLPYLVRPGMHVADVGSNLGLYTLEIARLVGSQGRVYAFEPDALMLAALRDNLAANHATQVEVFACAIGAEAGQVILQRSAFNSGDNRLGAATGTALHSEQVGVPVLPLHQALAGRRVDFIKMDVQGWEGAALQGLGPLLAANPDLQIYFEFWPHGLVRAGTSIDSLARLLRGFELEVYTVSPDGSARPADLAAVARTLPGQAYTNLLARRG
jgi:FkbM family methyltransferase